MIGVSNQKPQPCQHTSIAFSTLDHTVFHAQMHKKHRSEKTKKQPETRKTNKGNFIYQKDLAYVDEGDSAYSNWLLDLKFKKNKPVYLYDGKLKSNQDVQYGVLDIDIGKKDLIQCADAAIKLRADYLFEKNRCMRK